MAQPAAFRRAEDVRLDACRLIELYATLGEAAANATIGIAAEHICGLRDLLAGRRRRDAQVREVRLATAAAQSADRIGMPTLARVARDLVDVLQADDPIARAAVADRFVRVCDGSLQELARMQAVLP